jgi:hypothetical protein
VAGRHGRRRRRPPGVGIIKPFRPKFTGNLEGSICKFINVCFLEPQKQIIVFHTVKNILNYNFWIILKNIFNLT